MPFLHGFRRIIFEYQPLVDAILGALGVQDPERQEPLDGPSYATSEESRILVLTELLERKAQSPFYQEGVSNALLKMAELGLARAAAVLLRNGANLNFEGPPEPGGLGRMHGLSVALLRVGGPAFRLCFWKGLPSSAPRVMTKEAHTGWPPIPLQVSQWPLTTSDQEQVCHCFYQTRSPTTRRCTSPSCGTSRTWWSCWCATGLTSTAGTGSTRAAPWTWPARSQSACPACNVSWTSEQMSMRPTSMVRQPCFTLWPAVMGCRSTTPRTSGSCWKEGRTSRPLPKTETQCSPASSSCWARQWEATKRRPS